MTERRVERVARAMCWKSGQNPDHTEGGPLPFPVYPKWKKYRPFAVAAVEALKECLTPEYDSTKREDAFVELD